MPILAWIVLVLLGYGALTLWVAHIMRAFRRGQTSLGVALLALPPLLVLVLSHVRLPGPLAASGGFIAAFVALTLLILRLFRSPLGPPERESRPALLHLILISGSALFLIPFVWMVVSSLKDDPQIAHFPPIWVPHPVVWKNYPDALDYLPPESRRGLVNLQNTLIIAVLSVIGTVLSSSLVAYGFARLRWPGRDWVFGILLATMMLPDAVTMMPRFLLFRDLHWVDTLLPLWVPSFFASAFNVFLLRQFFLSIPQELEDAARIDGCGYFSIYWRIMLPLIKPALAAVTLMTFLGAWKDFLNPLIYISSPEKMPLSYVLALFNSAHGSQPALLMAATTLVMVPVVLLFFFTQRFFIEGVSFSGLGGR